MSVAVSVILGRKGADVITIGPSERVEEAVAALTDHNVGALVVTADGRALAGILSERDVVRELARSGPGCLGRRVEEIMTADVVTCSPETTVDDLMATMTDRRIRHVPVIADEGLAGVVSIGDVVKSRLDELELEAEALQDYVTGSSR